MKELEITNFELTYDGMYFISWENHQIRVYLYPPDYSMFNSQAGVGMDYERLLEFQILRE